MEGFYLICGHLLGDYILQNDWMAANKANPHPAGPRPHDGVVIDLGKDWRPEVLEERDAWDQVRRKWLVGHLACAVHCLLYTVAVAACSFWWMPWWGYAVCLLAHFAIDRFRLAGRWMRNVSGQEAFASGPLSPWSIIVVDNTFHLLTLAGIAAVAGRF